MTTFPPLRAFRYDAPQTLRNDISWPTLTVYRVLFEEGQSSRRVYSVDPPVIVLVDKATALLGEDRDDEGDELLALAP